VDPEHLLALETRIGLIHDLSRKHRCAPEQLPSVQEAMRRELDSLEDADQRRAILQSRLDALESAYRETARQLSVRRREAGTRLGRLVTEAMQALGMPGGVFQVDVQYDANRPFGPHGQDGIAFLVSANPGQPVETLSRVASGGELSRISLAIQAMSPRSACIPTVIFDEVDTGIGGGSPKSSDEAACSGPIARYSASHLPQVAALAHLVTGHQAHGKVPPAPVSQTEPGRPYRRTGAHAGRYRDHAADAGTCTRHAGTRAGRQTTWQEKETPAPCRLITRTAGLRRVVGSLARLVAAGGTDPVHIEAVIGHFIAKPCGNGFLPLLDHFVDELIHPSAFHAQDMVVMDPLVEFEHGMTALEVVALHQTSRFKLGQHPVNGRKPDVLADIHKARDFQL
jgi:hypothetical protein